MNNLPLELILNIIDRLNLENKLKCRLLSKKFLNVIDNFIENKRLYILSDYIFEYIRYINRFVPKNFIVIKTTTLCSEFDLSFFTKKSIF